MNNFIKLSVFAIGLSSAAPSFAGSSLTPNDDLIYSVKGIKNGVALLVGFAVNPILGAAVALHQPKEGLSDLPEIDSALARGANINHQEDTSGYTALIYAAYKGYPVIANHLITKGANVQIKEKGGYNALTMAQYYVNWYNTLAAHNERDEHDSKKRSEMRAHYQDLIRRYQAVADLVKPLTHDQTMPFSWWS